MIDKNDDYFEFRKRKYVIKFPLKLLQMHGSRLFMSLTYYEKIYVFTVSLYYYASYYTVVQGKLIFSGNLIGEAIYLENDVVRILFVRDVHNLILVLSSHVIDS